MGLIDTGVYDDHPSGGCLGKISTEPFLFRSK